MYIHDVVECPRCGKPHQALKFKPFTIPCKEHNYYSQCPDTKEPIVALVSVTTPAPLVRELVTREKEADESPKEKTGEGEGSSGAG